MHQMAFKKILISSNVPRSLPLFWDAQYITAVIYTCIQVGMWKGIASLSLPDLLVAKVLFTNAEYCVSFNNDFVLLSALEK